MRWTTNHRILIVMPALLLVLSVLLVEVHGPYHLGDNLDPEYAYLFNSLNLLTFHFPAHTDHPGTTLQEIGAGVLFVRWVMLSVFSPVQPLTTSVLSHPEDYLRAINFVLNLLFCGMLYLTARRILLTAGSLLPALVLQVSFLILHQCFAALTRVSPEPLLLTAALLLMWPLIPVVMGDETAARARDPRLAIWAGAAFAFGAVTKVTFLPLGAVVLLFPGMRQKARFLAAAFAAGILLMVPIATQLPRVASWMWSLAIHEGRYGGGAIGTPALSEIAGRLETMFTLEPFFYLFTGLYVFLLALALWRRSRGGGGRDGEIRLLGAVVTAVIVLSIVTAKHFAPHYPLPAMALIPFTNSFLAASFRSRLGTLGTGRAAMAAVLVLLLGGLAASAGQMANWLRIKQFATGEIRKLARMRSEMGDCRIAGQYRSSLPAFALSFGNHFSNRFHEEELTDLYPDVSNYNLETGRFETFTGASLNDQVALELREGRCVLLQAESTSLERIPNFRIEPVAGPGRERLVRVTEALAFPTKDYEPTGGVEAAAKPGSGAALGFEAGLASTGPYRIMVRYASAEPRPVSIESGGAILAGAACARETGGEGDENLMWIRAAVARFDEGPVELAFLSDGPLPRIERVVLEPLPDIR